MSLRTCPAQHSDGTWDSATLLPIAGLHPKRGEVCPEDLGGHLQPSAQRWGQVRESCLDFVLGSLQRPLKEELQAGQAEVGRGAAAGKGGAGCKRGPSSPGRGGGTSRSSECPVSDHLSLPVSWSVPSSRACYPPEKSWQPRPHATLGRTGLQLPSLVEGQDDGLPVGLLGCDR